MGVPDFEGEFEGTADSVGFTDMEGFTDVDGFRLGDKVLQKDTSYIKTCRLQVCPCHCII